MIQQMTRVRASGGAWLRAQRRPGAIAIAGIAVAALAVSIAAGADAARDRAAGVHESPAPAVATEAPAVPSSADSDPTAEHAGPRLEPFPRTFGIEHGRAAQPLTLRGSSLGDATSVRITSPDGAYVSTYSGRAITGHTPESIALRLVVPSRGVYRLVARTAAGDLSNEIRLVVR